MVMMPLRNMYLPESNGSILLTPRNLSGGETNVFEKAFNNEIDMESWQDWMRWDGSGEIDFPMLDGKENLSTHIPLPRQLPTDVATTRDQTMTTSLPEQENSFEDAPFEFDDTQTQQQMDTDTSTPQSRSSRGFLSLTESEERKLQDIAMPYRTTPAVKASPTPTLSTLSQSSPSPSPLPEESETSTRKYRKRKTSTDDEMPFALCQSRKRGHNAIEKRYRTNLNDKIICLRRGIPSLCRTSSSDTKSGEDEDSEGEIDSKTGQQKYGKAAILTRALEYIKHLENTTQRLGGEADALRTRVEAFEKLAMGGSLILSGNRMDVSNMAPMARSKTLECIQNEFKQLKPVRSMTGPLPKRKGSKQTRSQ